MKKIMEVYGELTVGLIVLVLLIVMLVGFFKDGTLTGVVEESSDAILGNSAVYEEHMEQAAPEAIWTGARLPVGNEVVLLSYVQIKTASSEDWVTASYALESDFSDFSVTVVTVNNVTESGTKKEVAYNSSTGIIKLPEAGIYQVNMTVMDKEKRTSGVTLQLLAE